VRSTTLTVAVAATLRHGSSRVNILEQKFHQETATQRRAVFHVNPIAAAFRPGRELQRAVGVLDQFFGLNGILKILGNALAAEFQRQ
jgi:hypothetical protein